MSLNLTKRHWLSVFGLVLLAAGGWGMYLAIAAADWWIAIQGMMLGTAGAFSVFAGERIDTPSLTWFQLGGLSYIVFAVQLVTYSVFIAIRADVRAVQGAMIVAFLVGGGVFLFVGADWFRGGQHFDISAFEPVPLFRK